MSVRDWIRAELEDLGVNRVLLLRLYRDYPARCNAVAVAVVVFVLAKLGIVLPHQTISGAVRDVLPVLLGGEATHRLVTPASPLILPPPPPSPRADTPPGEPDVDDVILDVKGGR